MFRELTTKEKALRINLDSSIYGSFAEIGAGQEIAAWFFKAGAASGTVAKTMSAYDMTFSDEIYGKCGRYVSEGRLMGMLKKEYELLPGRLADRASETRFFAVANTTETINYAKTNRGQGWMGVRFQTQPDAAPSECIMHVQLHDGEALWQQQALGIIGVNMLYACFFAHNDVDEFLKILMQNLSNSRIQVDMLRLSGPDFEYMDNRLLSLMLVKRGIAQAAMFGPDGKNLQAADVLYKKNILLLRGRFFPLTKVHLDMLAAGKKQFAQEQDVEAENIKPIFELTLNTLLNPDCDEIDEADFLQRVDCLGKMGQTVLISNFPEYYKIVNYLCQYNRKKKIGLVLGTQSLERIFDPKYYQHLEGGILEAFGKLFGPSIKMLIYPVLRGGKNLYTLDNFAPKPGQLHLFHYLFANDKLTNIEEPFPGHLHIDADIVLEKIRSGDASWEQMVPEDVVDLIKEKGFFL